MSKNYNVLAEYMVSKFIEHVSGDDIEDTFVDDNPAERVMVGMLAENRIEQSFVGGYVENSNTRFESVPSMSISFAVKKNDKGVLSVIPQGLLFYTVIPDYKKTVEFLIRKYSEKDNICYENIEMLLEAHPEEKFFLPLTYKSIRIEDVMGDGVKIRLDSLKENKFHLEEEICERLNELADSIHEEIRIIKSDRITFAELLNEDRFRLVAGVSDERANPRWDLDVYCTVNEIGDKYQFTLQLVNKTATESGTNVGYLPKVFNAGLRVSGNEEVQFQEIKLDYFNNSYKEREPVYVVAENTSVAFCKEKNEVYSLNVPKYIQHRLKTKNDFNEYITFENLIENPIGNLKYILESMEHDISNCETEFQHTLFASSTAKSKFNEAIIDYRHEINRFKLGITQIENRDFVKKAFKCMNLTFNTQLGTGTRKIKGWRLFQIVFIVSLIPEMIRSEYKDDVSISEADIEVANLLYFPTGGGKTEAFLGACVFDMFFDRYRGKNDGVSAFLKYPLRLLAVQQLDRVLAVVVKANMVRKNVPELSNKTPFRVGFFVGKANTPNKIDAKEKLSDRGKRDASQELILESDQDTLNEYYRFIDTCPCCGEKMINVHFNRDTWTLDHVCENVSCTEKVLPLMIVDNEIYRYLPSIIVSVVDKMALLGTTNEFRMLFGQVKKKCPVHGFSVGSKCLCSNCQQPERMVSVRELKDPIPTLFIQDELHLMTESLGAFDAHYESFINFYAKELVPAAHRKQIRFVGATATISMYKPHIQNLYHMDARRFPCEYPSVKTGEDFYSYTDKNDITRILVGYAPYGRSIIEGMWQSVYVMRLVCHDLFQHIDENLEKLQKRGFDGDSDELKNMLFNYWIELVYNNRKDDVVDLAAAFQNQGNNLLEAKGVPKFEIKQMTSDEDFQEVRQTLFNIQANRKKKDSTNLLLATKTISHGVDEDSFNTMFFYGMPNNNAEYIQAYSRVGRRYTGIVIDIIRLMRVRDRSYLKNFVVFHQNKDDLVESVPINRWAKNAVYSTLPGLLSGMLMQYYTIQADVDDFYHAYKVKKVLMSGKINIDDVIDKVIQAYGCKNQEKLSVAYEEIIQEQVANILLGIRDTDFDSNVFLSDAIGNFSKWKKKPMRSLRDTEEQIEIEIR